MRRVWHVAVQLVRRLATKSPAIAEAPTACSLPASSNEQQRIPEAPGPEECCGRGCANCVWIDYADELIEVFKEGGAAKARKIIEAKVDDVNLKSYLLMELKSLK
ncbi:hypothetical protein L596_005485 [Steinernema carpocapsae]|uniref:Oxidoreductase-like domain-containing protein n=1 Tax=Steinernema carpocapsae TaxID=34508 RepID=A0A4U8UZ54_STECR|nr:hypothetical protein L596_005485 [Steinernema carpocapsae]